MATELLAVGIGSASSDDLTVVQGSAVTVVLKGANGDQVNSRAKVKIEIKADDAHFYEVGELSNEGERARMIAAPGTYRFTRVANGVSVGVFSA